MRKKLITAVLTMTIGTLSTAQTFNLYIGGYTHHGGKGIYHAVFNADNGTLSDPKPAAADENPSFLVSSPDGRFLYAVEEKPQGAVTAFAIDAQSHQLKLLNRQSTLGSSPCHLVFSPDGHFLLAANYGNGSITVFPLRADGTIAAPSCTVQHQGKSINPQRQTGPHAHSVNFTPDGKLLIAVDLGLDRLMLYRFDPVEGKLIPHQPESVAIAPGSGPRHLTFHPNGRYAYVINELNSTITVLRYDAEAATFHELQTIGTLPAGYRGTCWPAEVAFHPNGRMLYGSNRAQNSLVSYRGNPDDGTLTMAGFQPQGIKNPRHFAIDPTGKFMLVGNQDADEVAVFRLNPAGGLPEPTGNRIKVATPTCICFAP